MCKEHAGGYRARKDEQGMILGGKNTTIHIGSR